MGRNSNNDLGWPRNLKSKFPPNCSGNRWPWRHILDSPIRCFTGSPYRCRIRTYGGAHVWLRALQCLPYPHTVFRMPQNEVVILRNGLMYWTEISPQFWVNTTIYSNLTTNSPTFTLMYSVSGLFIWRFREVLMPFYVILCSLPFRYAFKNRQNVRWMVIERLFAAGC